VLVQWGVGHGNALQCLQREERAYYPTTHSSGGSVKSRMPAFRLAVDASERIASVGVSGGASGTTHSACPYATGLADVPRDVQNAG
jgi:hypothetical protein